MKLKNVMRVVARFAREKAAVSALEYAIVVSVVIAGVGGALWAFSGNVETAIGDIGNAVEATAATAPTGTLTQPTP